MNRDQMNLIDLYNLCIRELESRDPRKPILLEIIGNSMPC